MAPDPDSVLDALQALAAREPEVGIRAGALFASRLVERPARSLDAAPPPAERRVLRAALRGSLDQLALATEPRRAPATGEVEIAVRAAALNFRDVMNVLGMYPGDPGALGSECSGVVVAVGAGVTRLRVGDEVVGLALDTFADYVTAAADMIVPKPPSLGFSAAATVPNAFLTAGYSLLTVARLRPGQRVLIHAAAGGVGLAALHLARRAGAQVLATAGSAEKRAFVLAQGASHAFDSRSAAFGADVLRATDGAGVDVVLNALSGDLIDAGLKALKPGGCFVEIGKKDIWSPQQVASRYPQARYEIVDLGHAIAHDGAAIREMLQQILHAIASGEMPPLPVRAFALDQPIAAFRHMATARHIGKVVLRPEVPAPAGQVAIRPDATYLVTGGFGGLGLAVAEWLATRGARHLVLVGRSAPAAAQVDALRRLEALGATVVARACDIADPAAVDALWRGALAGLPPLRGVLHTAGVLADAPLHDQTPERFEAVARPKLDGSWNLHAQLRGSPLDFFVLFSSSSALFGAPGQANYAAANSFMDALASHRRALGLDCTSIAWGAWGDAGMAARLGDDTRARWARAGIGMIDTASAMAALEAAILAPAARSAVVSLDTARFLRNAPLTVRAMFGEAAGAGAAQSSAGDAFAIPDPAMLRTLEVAERRALLQAYASEIVGRVLGFAASALDATASLTTLGLDSLMAVQLKNRIDADLGLTVPMAHFVRGPSVEEIVVELDELLCQSAAAAPADEQKFEEGLL